MEAWIKSLSHCIYCNTKERLFVSIHGGEDVETIQDLLQGCADIDARDLEGNTPLLLACLKDRKEIVELLINSGANVDAKCYRDNYTVLHYASKNGWINIVRTLLEKTPDLDARDIRGETAMHHASRSGCLEIVKCLVDEGAGINIKSSDFRRTALHIASMYGHSEIVKCLLMEGADINAVDRYCLTAFDKAIHNLEIVKLFVERGIDINSTRYNGLHKAIVNLEIIRLFVEKGIDINITRNYGLHAGTISGQLEVVKFLVEKGADINMKDFMNDSPVLKAAKYSHKDVVDLLICCGANVDVADKEKHTLLHYATHNGWMDTVQSIIKRNCDLNARNYLGRTALGVACKELKLDIVQYLLQAGASWDILDENGYSPLNYVTKRGDPEFKCIKLFIENGAYLKQVDYERIVKSSSLKVLQDVKLCCRTIVNKFNNHDLPQLFKLPASGNLPRIKEMKIVSGSEVAHVIERAVEFEIQTKGHCNVLEVHPMVLRVFSVRSVLEYCKKKKSEELQNQLKRRKVE